MYDLNKIKEIPCWEIVNEKGIFLKERGERFWGKIRNEKTASFSINKKNNLWYDFGSNEGGSVIELTELLYNFNKKEAINYLAKKIGLKVDSKKRKINRCGIMLMNEEEMLFFNIKKERATLNMDLNLEKQSIKELKNLERHYGITMEELFSKYPQMYLNIFKYKSYSMVDLLFKEIKENEEMMESFFLGESDLKILRMSLLSKKNDLISLLMRIDKIYPQNKYKDLKIF